MKCTNPVVFRYIKSENGKQKLEYYEHLKNLRHTRIDKHYDDQSWLRLHNFVIIPCNRCMNCRLNYRKQWADRLILASEKIKYKYFITLTYDEQNIEYCKTSMYADDDELYTGYSLVKDDIQKFFKRLRKYADKNNKIDNEHIQYYYCGEYGDKYGRPHFHIILFNFIIDDLEKEYSYNGNTYFQSDIITKLWNKGRTQVCNISYETCSYVAGYVQKKIYGKDAYNEYAKRGQVPEFVGMSRRPAIAKDVYINDKGKIYENDSMLVCRNDKVYEIKPCRYFDKLYDIDCPDELARIKLSRKLPRNVKLQSDKYGYDYLQTLAVKTRNKLNKSMKGDL